MVQLLTDIYYLDIKNILASSSSSRCIFTIDICKKTLGLFANNFDFTESCKDLAFISLLKRLINTEINKLLTTYLFLQISTT